MKRIFWINVLSLLIAAGFVLQSSAGILTIEDGNATVNIDSESQAGTYDFIVDGTDHLNKQWFWGRDAVTPEISLDNLVLVDEGTFDTNGIFGDTRDDKAAIEYTAGEFSVEIEYELTGGANGSGFAKLTELIRVTNLTQVALDLTFFQYSDFDMGGTAADDVVEILNGNTAVVSDGVTSVSESVITPAASTYEAALFSATLSKLNDANVDNLNGNAGPEGPGDVTWAFQWDVTLNPEGQSGSTFLISKIKSIQIVPEPASLALFGLGGFIMLRRRNA